MALSNFSKISKPQGQPILGLDESNETFFTPQRGFVVSKDFFGFF